jgi:tetratricopeptide (TPR) repeat protein
VLKLSESLKIHYVSEAKDFPMSMATFNSFFKMGFIWEPFSMKSKIDFTAGELIVLHNLNPEKLTVLQLLRNIKSKPIFSGVPILILSRELCQDAKRLLDSYDFVWHSEAPFNSNDYFSKLLKIADFSKTNNMMLRLFAFVKVKIAKNDPDEAYKKLEDLRKSYGNEYQINLMLTEIFRLKKDLQKAIEHAEKAKEKVPHSLEVNALLTALYQESGQTDKLTGLLEETTELAKIQMTNFLHWGDQYIKEGDDQKANRTFHAALKLDPEKEKAKQGLVAANILAGKSDITEDLPSTSFDAIEIARICNLNGIAMVNSENFAAAERLYSNAIKFIPKEKGQHKVYYNLGLCMKKSDELEKAKIYFEKSAKVSPQDSEKARAQLKWIDKTIEEEKKKLEDSAIDYSSFKK